MKIKNVKVTKKKNKYITLKSANYGYETYSATEARLSQAKSDKVNS